jgi:Lipopolysaccharide-assembly, LptC-related
MRWAALMLFLAAAALGCGDPAPTTPPISEDPTGAPTGETAAPKAQEEATFYFFEDNADSEGEQKPSFEMRGDISMNAERVVSCKNTRSIIRPRTGEEVHVSAASGRYDPNAQTAIMEDGVVMEVDTMRIELVDLLWVNEERTAKSNKPVKIIDGDTVLEASSMEYSRDTGLLLLRDAAGTIKLEGGETP